ncbi:MAG: 30S ribosomal protein S20 [Bacillota bacterium]
MPNIKSAEKRARLSQANRERNQAMRSRLKTAVKKSETDIKAGDNKPQALQAASKALDRAAASGIIHKNTAARKKARLAKWAAKNTSNS